MAASSFEQFAKERRQERCRSCVYFMAEDLKCRIWPANRLKIEAKHKGCSNFRRDIWAEHFQGGAA